MLSRLHLWAGKPTGTVYKPHHSDVSSLEAASILEQADFVKVATAWDDYAVPPTVSDDAIVGIWYLGEQSGSHRRRSEASRRACRAGVNA